VLYPIPANALCTSAKSALKTLDSLILFEPVFGSQDCPKSVLLSSSKFTKMKSLSFINGAPTLTPD